MSSIRPFSATDLFELNSVNLDPLTENFYLYFYLQYLSEWPSLFYKVVSPSNDVQGYMLAKTEGKGKDWHAHISAVTVNPNYRRIGLASTLCSSLERFTENEPYEVYFIDLFVRCNNKLAIVLYEKLGYSVYRRVVGYYGDYESKMNRNKIDDEIDAFDMRKALKRDINRESVRADGRKYNVLPNEIVF
ncbi:hypothetical protein KL925_000688 [Ogataea polymorpha]|uniref:uncharacterized protein n=1 Tax=Ogataea polymorpha TaxID=460523 RepID=UPI0007F490D5|nr:uncharacterized protein OGAPODRAFT_94564 [Ogataea polymorpha]KAG7883294.1 hypothetical protein KL937_000467 [Ogataea polymorpha]KAG7908713.1 hypothetical protein KL906_002944 [Ogataea polymorpha]KAG7929946.1 hypothetical protein KL925_000688 [Ogataea polymorpha]KAG7940217.1 hypothetical protein KL904_000080 [Ogataea polymorpha]OBA14701.1 hypothetical protein OGAPODRAFT_94564 [Ogataea polymorpha]